MLDHAAGDLTLAHDDEVRAELLEALTSASEWARAGISMPGSAARACSAICPASKASGIAITSQRASAGRPDHVRRGGVALERLQPRFPRPVDQVPAILDHEQPQALPGERLGDEAPGAAEAMSGEWRGIGQFPPYSARPILASFEVRSPNAPDARI